MSTSVNISEANRPETVYNIFFHVKPNQVSIFKNAKLLTKLNRLLIPSHTLLYKEIIKQAKFGILFMTGWTSATYRSFLSYNDAR